MTPRFRIAAVAALTLFAFAGVARAATSAVPPDVEKKIESPQVTLPYLDYASCPTPAEQQKVQIQAQLQVNDEERGVALEKGSCAVASSSEAPTQVDSRYSIGE